MTPLKLVKRHEKLLMLQRSVKGHIKSYKILFHALNVYDFCKFAIVQ